ncbi:MAG: hypothetical protein ACRD8W_08100 [Nitrososphaeraceae archaeon]
MAILGDILAIAMLSAVTTMVQTGDTSPQIMEVIFHMLWKSERSIEGIVTASFFVAAGIAALVGLSLIVGAFARVMAVANTRFIKQIDKYVGKLLIIFGPFFAIRGAQVD